jgi:hypothetical protein
MARCTWVVSLSAFSITCQVTNHPISPITAKLLMKVTAVARPRAIPQLCSRLTVGCSSAVMSSPAAKAITTRLTTLTTFIST